MGDQEQIYDLVEVFAAISKGDVKAFTTFYQAYRSKVFQVMFKMTRSVEAAQELSQKFFIKFWEKREAFTTVQEPEAYVFRSLYNMATDYLRAKGNEKRLVELDRLVGYDYSNDTQEQLDERQLQQLMQEAIATLPDKQRAIVQLRHEGISYEAIASDLHISKGTAQNYYHEALKLIRRYISSLLTVLPLFL